MPFFSQFLPHWTRTSLSGYTRFFRLVSTIVLGLWVLAGCAAKQENLSTELQALKDKYAQIAEEMTEDQVDAIMVGHRSTSAKEINDVGAHGPQKRRSTLTKTYWGSGLKEGDYLVQVFFDDYGYVVGKSMSEICK
jgi:outer membrane murein-binding lipoprotein Lpp